MFRKALLVLAFLFTASPTEAKSLRLKHLSQKLVDVWYLEEYTTSNDPLSVEGFSALPATWAFVYYDIKDRAVVVYPHYRPQEVMRITIAEWHSSEMVYHTLRSYGYRTIFATTENQDLAERLRPLARHAVAYVNSNNHCKTAPCNDTFVVVMISQWNR